ncbi:hypothetical protein EJB05_34459 [Eragrostis curvula]|uniref:Cupin type-1 domain-containing protein n=1 Tax=Eragrostis curvula TaxID=38414 RepID=A0A5J9U529_9POAL|nr:hypothetical protein EJB05_34459 [Eragrostis curvula]
MAPALCSLLLLLLLLHFCFHGSTSAFRGAAPADCSFDRLQPLEPLLKVQSEAGYVDYFERYWETDDQLRCAGVFPIRVVIEPQGLLLPRYINLHGLVYILQGRGVVGFSYPGCPPDSSSTYQQQFQQCGGFRDEQQQQMHRFGEGDVVAMPAGTQRWMYNDGDQPVVAVYIFDISNTFNQLEPEPRKFLLAGCFNKDQDHYSERIFKGFSVEMLSETLGVSADVARKLQNQNDGRGEIVRVEHGLQLASRPRRQATAEHEHVSFDDESVCTMEVAHNIENPDLADFYSRGVGRITRLNNQKFPILNLIKMSVTRVDLYQNASLSPFWNLNAHSVMYAIQGRARVQVVNNHGTCVFDGVLRAGQLLIIPQNFVVAEKAEDEGFQYISFKTNPNSLVSHIARMKNSVFGTMPADIIASSYGIFREDATELKSNSAFAP